jgi:hypothetical protein
MNTNFTDIDESELVAALVPDADGMSYDDMLALAETRSAAAARNLEADVAAQDNVTWLIKADAAEGVLEIIQEECNGKHPKQLSRPELVGTIEEIEKYCRYIVHQANH